jgi:hypothetical protein
MFYMSQSLTDSINAEFFYQLEWDHTVVDNCGTFFGVDPIPGGCNDRLVIGGYDLPPGEAQNVGLANIGTGGDNTYIPRGKDKDARDGGQWGLALRWFAPELNDTEFGAYVMNYHSRNPYLSFKRTTTEFAAGGANQAARIRTAGYAIEYPEDVRLYGLSFQSNLDGTSLGGELSFRPNMPLQINTADMNLAAISQFSVVNGAATAISPYFISGYGNNVAGADLPGYKRMPVLQAQVSATRFFDQVMGASRLTLIGEVGYNRINGLGDTDGSDIRFGRNPVWGAGQLADSAGAVGANACLGTNPGTPLASNPAQKCSDKGFYTTDSWGYRGRAILNYNNVVAGINLSPNLAWSHDVNGNGPNFEEGLKAISIGVDADYGSTYTASLSYTDFFGGDFNTNGDRDFVALSFGVNF